MDATASVIVHDELAYSDPGFTLGYLAHALLFVNNFYCGGERRRSARATCRDVLAGELVGAMGMTEPAVGTDVLGMQTTARSDGDDYVLNGRKTFITNGPEAGVFLIYAKLDDRITSFVVERGFAGLLDRARRSRKIGMRASTMCELIFDDCRVPAENLLGTRGRRHHEHDAQPRDRAARPRRDEPRHRAPLPRRDGHATRPSAAAFGKPLAEHGQIQRYIGESYAKIEAMRALIYNVAATVGPTQRNRLGTDAAKLFAATAAKEVADAAIQVLGGYGYCTEYRVEQFLRDAKLIEIGGGTLEAHQKNITRDLTRR